MIACRTNNLWYCGGTLLTQKHVLTAAHCAWKSCDESDMIIILGIANRTQIKNENVMNVVKIDRHPNWKHRTQQVNGERMYDVAVLTMEKKIKYTKVVSLNL